MNDNIFNNPDLYPTPIEVINKMFLYSSCEGKIVLEPSAGTGNIVDYLKAMNASTVIACESNDKLRQILHNKCNIISNDFLTVRSEDISHINMIVMNPPFSADEQHILHAWDIAPSGCEILALCNYNSINSPSNRMQGVFRETVDKFGQYEYFGNCFKGAERRTDVEIGFIRLLKPIEEKDDFAGYFDMDDEDSIDKSEEGITTYNYVQDIVSRYVDALKKFSNVTAVEADMNETISIFNCPIKFQPSTSSSDDRYTVIDFEIFRKRLQASAWRMIFSKFKMEKYVTKGVREDLNKFIETQQQVPFTVKNVYKMLQMVVGTQGERMNKVLIEAFERICSFSDQNSTAGETWRTNSNYKINRKFIHPWICKFDTRWPKSNVDIDYQKGEDIDDIVKALCFLTGKSYDDHISLRLFVEYKYHIIDTETGKVLPYYDNFFQDHNRALDRIARLNSNELYERYKLQTIDNTWGQWIEWCFFRVKGFKKGTMHFEFLDQKVCDEFNMRVAKAKGWRLPSDTKSGPRAKSTEVTLF